MYHLVCRLDHNEVGGSRAVTLAALLDPIISTGLPEENLLVSGILILRSKQDPASRNPGKGLSSGMAQPVKALATKPGNLSLL